MLFVTSIAASTLLFYYQGRMGASGECLRPDGRCFTIGHPFRVVGVILLLFGVCAAGLVWEWAGGRTLWPIGGPEGIDGRGKGPGARW
jgi:hypothetical protein